MSYPSPYHGYTPITLVTGDPTLLIASEAPPLAPANAPPTGGAPQDFAPRVQKRRSSKPTTGRQLSRSASTPQLKSAGSMSDDDKKRNKLGYQRISIACAHCRRRKIRCLLADGDPHQRCQNCIRLKRECVFYPVDQQSVVENRSQSSSKTGVGSVPSSGVSPSPPDLGPSKKPFERERPFGSFHSLPSNAPPGFQGLPLESSATLPGQSEVNPGFTAHGMSDQEATRAPQPDFRFQSRPDSHQQWDRSEAFGPQGEGIINQSTDPYWRSSPIMPSADFTPFHGTASALGQVPPNQPYPYPAPEMNTWQPQQHSSRSASYDNMQGNAHHAYLPSGMVFQSPGQPNGPATYPPLGIHRSSAQVSMSDPHSTSVGTPMTPLTQAPPFMYQTPGAIAASPLPGQPNYQGGWYQGSAPFSSADHETQPPPGHIPYTKAPR